MCKRKNTITNNNKHAFTNVKWQIESVNATENKNLTSS